MTPTQCKMARVAAGLSQEKLAEKARVSVPSIADYESGRTTPRRSTLHMIRMALEASGVIFTENDGFEWVGIANSEPQTAPTSNNLTR